MTSLTAEGVSVSDPTARAASLARRPGSRALFGAAALAPALVLAAGVIAVWVGLSLYEVALGGLLLGFAHLIVCLRAAARITRAPVADAPEEALGASLWIWLVLVGRAGGGVVGFVLAALLVLAGEVSMFGLGVTLVAGRSALVEVAGPLAFFAMMAGCCLTLGGRGLAWAALRAELVHHDQRTIRHQRARQQAQGGALSMPAESSAGELSMAQQRGELAVHEVEGAEQVIFEHGRAGAAQPAEVAQALHQGRTAERGA